MELECVGDEFVGGCELEVVEGGFCVDDGWKFFYGESEWE